MQCPSSQVMFSLACARASKLQHQTRFAHASLSGNAHDLPLPGLDLTEPLTQRGQFPFPTNQA